MNEVKCLVKEAREKCECDDCIYEKKLNEWYVESYIRTEALKLWIDTLLQVWGSSKDTIVSLEGKEREGMLK